MTLHNRVRRGHEDRRSAGESRALFFETRYIDRYVTCTCMVVLVFYAFHVVFSLSIYLSSPSEPPGVWGSGSGSSWQEQHSPSRKGWIGKGGSGKQLTMKGLQSDILVFFLSDPFSDPSFGAQMWRCSFHRAEIGAWLGIRKRCPPQKHIKTASNTYKQ